MGGSLAFHWNPLPHGYMQVREVTDTLCEPLEVEDHVVQAIPEASPPKWHLAHTTWFFETFVLRRWLPQYVSYDERYQGFFNSYYVHVSERVPQHHRGTFSRPTLQQVREYREFVDIHMSRLIEDGLDEEQHDVVELGLHHEQQHQELLVMDIKAHLFQPPFFPAYCEATVFRRDDLACNEWQTVPGGLVDVGYGGSEFCYDNERPLHKVHLEPFELSTRTITNAEWLDFMNSGGYQDARLWLSDGWKTASECGWQAPAYWIEKDGQWHRFTLHGLVPIDLDSPVSHVSFYEADAYARWAGRRLPREIEWEAASQRLSGARGAFLEDEFLDPFASDFAMAGNVWEWTSSAYEAYPGYSPPPAAFGEYNAKFMVNQKVLRGGCCATPLSHYRPTYRNFFYPHQRWQFSGVRLAR